MTCARPIHGVAIAACLLTGCDGFRDPLAPPAGQVDQLRYPTGLALHPTLPVLFVSSSNFDLATRTGAVLAANLQWLRQELRTRDRVEEPIRQPWDTGVQVPSIGAALAITPDGRHLFHTTRQNSRLVQLEVDAREDIITLSCGSGASSLPDCSKDSDHVTQLPFTDPFDLVLRRNPDGWRAYVSSLGNGRVAAVDLKPAVTGRERMTVTMDKELGDLDHGGYLALLPAEGGAPDYLFSSARELPGDSRSNGVLRYFSLLNGPASPVYRMDIRDQAGSIDARGIAFARRRARAYAVSKLPAVLAELSTDRLADGAPAARALRLTQLGREPSALALYEPAAAPNLVLTVSFKDNALMAVDMDTMSVFGVLWDVGLGPFEMAVDEAAGLAFVTCFQEDTVAVVRLPRSHDDLGFFVAARLGVPRDSAPTNPELPSLDSLTSRLPRVGP